MLKFKLTQSDFDALSDEQKGMYQEAEGSYQLAVEGLPDVSRLEAKVNELLGEKKSEKAKREAAEQAAREAAEAQARKDGDLTTIENSWRQKLKETEERYQGQISGLNGSLNTLLVDNVANSLATDLAGESAAVMLPHLRSRLAVEMQDGKPATRVLDAAGQPSALTVEELASEFRANKAFSGVVIGSRASGPGGIDTAHKTITGTGAEESLASRAAAIIKQTGIE